MQLIGVFRPGGKSSTPSEVEDNHEEPQHLLNTYFMPTAPLGPSYSKITVTPKTTTMTELVANAFRTAFYLRCCTKPFICSTTLNLHGYPVRQE